MVVLTVLYFQVDQLGIEMCEVSIGNGNLVNMRVESLEFRFANNK